jgi:hypothetical protein
MKNQPVQNVGKTTAAIRPRHPPTRPGIDYMLSTENFVPDNKGVVAHFPPHVMFCAPYLTNAARAC